MSGGSKQPFRFQQFTVRDDHAAMKVGTDGVLLGAWAPIRGAKRILDIGTGCGIVAMMLAQRTVDLNSNVSAIDVNHRASAQALENFQNCPWPNRLPQQIREIHHSLGQFVARSAFSIPAFNLAVCNPPFFNSSFPPADESRRVARQTVSLTTESLIR